MGRKETQIGEKYIMPSCIRHLIRNASKNGEWNPEKAVEKYLEEIKEEDIEPFKKFFVRLKENLGKYSNGKRNFISGDLIIMIAENIGISSYKADIIRGEFKKGGVISPCSSTIKGGCLKFEINPSLLERNKSQ